MNQNFINLMKKHNKEPIIYNVNDKDNKVIGTIFCSYSKIYFRKNGFNGGLDVTKFPKVINLDLWSDFAEKDDSAKRISGAIYGRSVTLDRFISDMKEHMPHHFEWCIWNMI